MSVFKQTKRFLFLILSVLLIFSCNEEEKIDLIESVIQNENFVTIEEANEIGSVIDFPVTHNFDNSSTVKSSKDKKKKIKSINQLLDESNTPICYVINYKEGGFVVLSAEKRIYPILAYSEFNSFELNVDEYPLGIDNWMSMLKYLSIF